MTPPCLSLSCLLVCVFHSYSLEVEVLCWGVADLIVVQWILKCDTNLKSGDHRELKFVQFGFVQFFLELYLIFYTVGDTACPGGKGLKWAARCAGASCPGANVHQTYNATTDD